MKLEQFAAMNMVYQRYSFKYALDSMQKLGIDKFELWAGGSHPNCYVSDLSDMKALKKELDRRGMTVTCMTPEQCIYPYNIATPNAELRRQSLDYFLKYIDMTAELGVEKMLCGAGWGDLDEPVEDAWKRSVESLWTMTKHAEKRGVKLAFEILQFLESNLVYNYETTRRMFDEIQHPNFCLCVDTVPMRVDGKTLDDFFKGFGDRIIHIHLTDGTPTGHLPLGAGDIDVREQFDALDRNGYTGDVTLELGAWMDRPEESTKLAFDTVKSIYDLFCAKSKGLRAV